MFLENSGCSGCLEPICSLWIPLQDLFKDSEDVMNLLDDEPWKKITCGRLGTEHFIQSRTCAFFLISCHYCFLSVRHILFSKFSFRRLLIHVLVIFEHHFYVGQKTTSALENCSLDSSSTIQKTSSRLIIITIIMILFVVLQSLWKGLSNLPSPVIFFQMG